MALGFAATASASETPIPPPPTHWLTDDAHLLSPASDTALDQRLEAYEHATGHQVIVWIGTTLGDAPIDDWAARAFATWGLGRKGLDDGVGIFIFASDHKDRIEVGYGLEDRLPDAYASRILRDTVEPALRAGHPDEAVTAAIDGVIQRIGSDADATGSSHVGARQHGGAGGGLSLVWIIVIGIGAIAFIAFAITHPVMALYLLDILLSSRGGGGGGFGGGDGGGFSGGGGRSGGGGASGSW